MPYGPSVPSKEQLLAYFTHFEFLSDLSTCVDGLLWLELLSSWAPEVENQFLFINPGSAGRVILEVEIRWGEGIQESTRPSVAARLT